MIRLSRDQHEWGFASARVSVLEGRLAPTEFFQSLVGVEQNDDLLHRLQETQMRDYLAPGATWEDWSAITDTYFCDHVASLRKDTPVSTVSDLFALSNDYINLKRALMNPGSYPMACGTFDEALLTAVAGGNTGALPREVREPLAQFGGAVASDPAARVAVDIVLDGAYLRQLLALGDALEVPMIRSWLSEMTLARAAVALWRAVRIGANLRVYQQYFLPVGEHTAVLNEMIASADPQNWGVIIPGEIGDLWREAQQVDEDEQIMRFGVLMYNRLTSVARQGRLQTMGPERVFGYLWGLLVEVYNLRLIITGRLNGIDPDLLRRRLREAYV